MATFKVGDTVKLVQPLGAPTADDEGTPAHEALFRVERIDEASGVVYILNLDGTTSEIQEASPESLLLANDA